MDPASNPGAMSEEKLGLSASLQEIAAVGTEKNSGEGSSAASMKCTAAGAGVGVPNASTLSAKPGSETACPPAVKSGLPPYVVACNNLEGRTRYGVKIKIPGRKGQMRVGSAFADPQSASLAANVFQSTARVNAETGDIQLDSKAAMFYKTSLCSIFKARSVNVTQMSVVEVLEDILQKRTARIKTRKAKRKRDGTRPAASSTSLHGGARAASDALASASGALVACAPAAAPAPAAASAAAGSAKSADAAKVKADEGARCVAAPLTAAENMWFPLSGFLGPISGLPSGSGDSAAFDNVNGRFSPLHSLTSRETGRGVSARNSGMSFSPSNTYALDSLLSSTGGGEAAGGSWLDGGKGEKSQPWTALRSNGNEKDMGRPKSLDRIDRIDSARGSAAAAAAAAAAQRYTPQIITLSALNPAKITVGTSVIVEARGSKFSPSTNFFATTLDGSGFNRREVLQTWRGDDTTRCLFEVHGIDPGTYHVYASNDLATFSNLLAFEVAVKTT